MDTIEKIRTKIDRMLDDICEADGFVQKKDEPRYDALAEVLDFIDTLEEEPDKNLEEAANEFANQDCVTFISRKKGFIAGAEWQKDALLEWLEGQLEMLKPLLDTDPYKEAYIGKCEAFKEVINKLNEM